MPAPDTNARQEPKIRSGQVRVVRMVRMAWEVGKLPTVGQNRGHMPPVPGGRDSLRTLVAPRNYANFFEFLTHLYYLLFSFFWWGTSILFPVS